MTGGYLRVMYPEPEVCLNLPAWQEFCGFDREGQNGWFDISVDEDTGKVTVSTAEDRPLGIGRQLERLKMIFDPKDVKKVAAAPDLPWKQEGTVLPGLLREP
jgi:hypothetical protein